MLRVLADDSCDLFSVLNISSLIHRLISSEAGKVGLEAFESASAATTLVNAFAERGLAIWTLFWTYGKDNYAIDFSLQ
jgi:hypothetical protein